MSADPTFGLLLVAVGLILFVLEFVHPGAFLLIPGSITLAAGLMYFFVPDFLLGSIFGPGIILMAALASALITVPYYKRIAPVHPPMTSTTSTLLGETGIVTAAIEPNTLKGKVRIRSEIWSARGKTPIPAGTMVQVVGGEGVSLEVRPVGASPVPS
ncbi:MAG: NfeD family protein [Thermoplasmata archaeon]|nr:NfeD family protein [Thermoplasmata archaeon]